MIVSSPVKLSGIEALRGIAAVAVVLSHVGHHAAALGAETLGRVASLGHAGVDLFFVLSGFIILHVHSGDVSRPEQLGHYAWRRVTRIAPLYWLALAVTVAIGCLGGHDLPDNLLWSASLLPSNAQPVLGVAWTLQYEAVFYVVFAVMITNRTVGHAVFVGWLAFTVGCLVSDCWVSIGRAYTFEFAFGMAAAAIVRRSMPRPRALAALGMLSFAVALWLEWAGVISISGTAGRLLYGAASAVLILGVVVANQNGRLRAPRWLVALGGASYAVYLFHLTGNAIAWQVIGRSGLIDRVPLPILFVAVSAAAVLGGVVIARWIERPILGFCRAIHLRRAVPIPVTG